MLSSASETKPGDVLSLKNLPPRGVIVCEDESKIRVSGRKMLVERIGRMRTTATIEVSHFGGKRVKRMMKNS
jgi:hypothetical protein